MDEKQDIVTLIDEDGGKFEFVVVDYFLVDELEYAVLVPLPENLAAEEGTGNLSGNDFDQEGTIFDNEEDSDDYEEDDEAIILRVLKGNNGEASLHVIEDEDEWQRVSEIAFNRMLEEGLE